MWCCKRGSRASLVAQMLKRLPGMWETRVRSLGREDPLEKEMATHSSTHAGFSKQRIPVIQDAMMLTQSFNF